MRRDSSFLLLTLASVLVLASLLAAQSNPNLEAGLKPYGAYQNGDVDTVNLENGNVTLRIPLFSYPQRGGLQLSFYLIGNNKNWAVTRLSNGHLMWKSTGGGVAGRWNVTSVVTRRRTVISDLDLGTQSVATTQYAVHSGDGSVHALGWTSPTVAESADASGYRFEFVSGGGDGSSDMGTLVDSNGVRYVLGFFGGAVSCTTDGSSNICTYDDSAGPVSVEDPNGNKVTLDTSIHDSVGRTFAIPDASSVTTDYSGCVGTTNYAYVQSFPAVSGGTDTVKFCLRQYTLSTNFGVSGIAEVFPSPVVQMLTTVVLPNQTTWQFDYDAYGDLSKVVFPTGGSITYGWTTISITPTATTPVSRAVASRTVNANDGTGGHTWTYSYGSQAQDGTYTRTVTTPAGDDSVHVFSPVGGTTFSLYETSASFYQGTGAGRTLLKTVTTVYAGQSSPFGDNSAMNVVPTTITTTWPGGKVSQVQRVYDSGNSFHGTFPNYSVSNNYPLVYGSLVQEAAYDYGPGAPGPLLRKTIKNYVWQSDVNYKNLNLMNLVASAKVCSALGTGETGDCDTNNALKRRAETDYAYDQGTPAASGVGTQHDANPVTGTHRGNLTTTSRWLNTTNSFLSSTATYFDSGMVQQTKDPLLHATTFTYSSTFAGAYPTQACNALSQCASTNYDFNTGLVLSTTDPNGNTSSTAYDGMFRATQQNLPDGGQTTFAYNDALPNPSVTVTTKINATQNTTSTAVVDGLGRVVQTQLTSDPAGTVYVDTTYDGNGRKASVSNPHRSGVNSTDGITSYQYDGLGRVVKEIPPDGTTSSNNVATVYIDNCVTVTDQAGKQRKSCSDALGRLVQVFESPNSSNYETDYTYDALGNLLCVEQHGGVTGTGCAADPSNDATSPWRVRRSTYDSLSRLLTAKNPESGTVSWTYDNDSKVISKTDARGIVITYSYDALDRVTGKTYSNNDAAVSYLYDQTSYNGLAITNGVGRQTGMADASGQTAWSFDVMGRALTERRTISGVTKSVGYTYNLDGSVATVVYPSGRTITYSYNNAGQAVSAQDQANGINYASAATYAPAGELAGVTYGASGSFAGIVTANSFNRRLQPITLSAATTGTGGQTVMSLSYNWNLGTADNGTIAKIVNNRDNNRSQNFTYDALNRVASAYTDGTNWGSGYTVDAWGNLTNKTPKTGKVTGENLQQVALGSNRFSGMSYDPSGNLLFDGSTYTYDAENRIKTAAGVTYTYDGNGERVAKSTGVLYWGGSSKDALDESDGAGNLTSEYVFFNGKRCARLDLPGGAVHYYLSDHLGSSNVVASSTGAIEEESDFYPYGGEIVVADTGIGNHYKFTGKERDPETGVDYFFARYYSSALGRFLTPDWSATPVPVPYANPGNPQTLNLYSYVENNPITGTDPDGHFRQAMFDSPYGNEYSDSPGPAYDPVKGANDTNAHQKEVQLGQLSDALAKQVTPEVKAAILAAVRASGRPAGDDTNGGFHEESLMVGITTSGKTIVIPCVPGPRTDPSKEQPNTSFTPVDPEVMKDVKTVTMFIHVHPAGTVEVKEDLGVQRATHTVGFGQPPSPLVDVKNAVPGAINIVVGAGDQRVYFFNRSGIVGVPIKLKDFMKMQ